MCWNWETGVDSLEWLETLSNIVDPFFVGSLVVFLTLRLTIGKKGKTDIAFHLSSLH